jgi:hypothetical protein
LVNCARALGLTLSYLSGTGAPKRGKGGSVAWPVGRVRRSIRFVGHLQGLAFNWAFALGAWAVAGPFWAVIAFVTVAFLRVTLEAQGLRLENAELRSRLLERAFSFDDYEPDAPPASGTRPVAGPLERAELASEA